MVKVNDCKEPCFAHSIAGCRVLTVECTGSKGCPFYKPVGCEDWIRSERKDGIWLIPPEEYYDKMRLLRK